MYWIILGFVLFGCFRYDLLRSSKNYDVFYNTVLVIVVLTSAFAYHIGGDASSYQYIFDRETPKLWDLTDNYMKTNGRWQPGFLLFMSLCKTIVPSYYFFKLVYASILNITIFHFVKRYTDYPFFAILFYICIDAFYFNFEIYREVLAICIFLWAYSFVEKREWLKYYAFCALAFLFHMSALVVFFVPLFQMLRVGRISTLLITSIIVIVLIVFNHQLNPIAMQLMMFSDDIESNYGHYLDSEVYGESRLSLNMILTYFIDIVIPFVMLYVIPKNRGRRAYYGIVQIAPILVVVGSVIPIFNRFANYFSLFNLIFFIEIFEYLTSIIVKRRHSAIFALVCVLYVSVSFYRHQLRSNEYGVRSLDRYYPYSSIFTKHTYHNRESNIYYWD